MRYAQRDGRWERLADPASGSRVVPKATGFSAADMVGRGTAAATPGWLDAARFDKAASLARIDQPQREAALAGVNEALSRHRMARLAAPLVMGLLAESKSVTVQVSPTLTGPVSRTSWVVAAAPITALPAGETAIPAVNGVVELIVRMDPPTDDV